MTHRAGDRFTIADYQAILDAARREGYAFAQFTDSAPDPGIRIVYLRHDIDNCIESALLMAELEARSGVASTYLPMVRSPNYNPFTPENTRRLRRICELGHEVGLHFVVDQQQGDLVSRIQGDARLLERVTGAPVRVFSFHNPSENDAFRIDVPDLINTYADRFFRDAFYMSESNMRWRRFPIDVLASREHPVIQILVHPLSYREAFESDRDVLLWFLRDVTRNLLEVNVRENRVLREQRVSIAEVGEYIGREAGQQ